MSDVKAIEDAVRSLPPQKLAEFGRWFVEFDNAAWDAQFEDDLSAGKLDSLLAEAQPPVISDVRPLQQLHFVQIQRQRGIQ